MKKVLLLIGAILMMHTASAQFGWGFFGGPQLSNVCGDEAESWEGLITIHVGLMGNLAISDDINFQPEIVFSRQGADYSETYEGFEEISYSGTVNIDYLNIPLIFQYEVADGLTLEAGPQVGFVLSAKDNFEGGGESGEEDVKDLVKSTAFGANIGAGYTFDNGIRVAARYNLGLTEINDDDSFGEGVSWKNHVVQVSLGYYIKFDKIKGESQD